MVAASSGDGGAEGHDGSGASHHQGSDSRADGGGAQAGASGAEEVCGLHCDDVAVVCGAERGGS